MFYTKKRAEQAVKRISNRLLVGQYHQSFFTDKPLKQDAPIAEVPVVVSLTTYSKRVHDVYLTIESLRQQTVLPNEVVLWLSEEEFNSENIPQTLKRLISSGLTIKFCKDFKSYKKIVPSITEHPNSIIITIDDDIIYPHDFIELLVLSHSLERAAIIGNRGHHITFGRHGINPYKEWIFEAQEDSDNLFLTGAGGILYPPGALHSDVLNDDLFMSLCPRADDVWLFAMARMNKTKIKFARYRRSYSQYIEIPFNEDIGLNKHNVTGFGNDVQIKNLVGYYGLAKMGFEDLN